MIYSPIEPTVEIPLTKGYVALVDPADSNLLAYWWTAIEEETVVYAHRHRRANETGPITIRMHRVIMARVLNRELTKTEQVDHIDNDGLNNRRSNLRLATHAENQRNSRMRRNNTSGYKGVCFNKVSQKWKAQIMVNGKVINLGAFDTPEKAHAAYIEAAKKHYGKFAHD